MRVAIVSDDQQLVREWGALLRAKDSFQVYDQFDTIKADTELQDLSIVDVRVFSSQEIIDLIQRYQNGSCPLILVVSDTFLPVQRDLWDGKLTIDVFFERVLWPARPEDMMWALEKCERIQSWVHIPSDVSSTIAQVRLIAEWAPYIMWTRDVTGSFSFMNKFGLDFLGAREEEVLGHRWQNFFHPDDKQSVLSEFRKAIELRQPYRLTVRLRRADGVYRWVEVIVGPRYGSDFKQAAFVGAAFDVTEQREADEYLRSREKFLQEFAESLSNIVFQTDPEGRIVFMSKQWEHLTGSDLMRDGEGSEIWPQYLHADDRASAMEQWERSLKTGEKLHIKFRIRDSATGQYRWHMSIGIPIRDQDGKILKWYGSVTDIDDVIVASEEVKRLCTQLERTNLLKDEFLAVLSHELRTPIHVISGHAELLADAQPGDEDWRESTEAITRNTTTLTRLVEDLLDASRYICGKMFIRPSMISLPEIITSVVDGLRFTWQTKQLHVETSLPEQFPLIMADGERIRQVACNLIINSIKFTPPGGRIYIMVKHINDSEVVMEVSDTGIGISVEYLPLVFDRFSQQDSSSTRFHGGLGLGLALVKHIVELHGGSASACSPGIGKGATMTVRLPIYLPEGGAAPASHGA